MRVDLLDLLASRKIYGHAESSIFVRLGESRFFCKQAWAEFD